MTGCRITILQCGFNQELVDLSIDPERRKNFGKCEVFQEGQEFIVDPFKELPQGFCPWAWDDIYKTIVYLMTNEGEDQEDNCVIACCTDGTRPVTFKIERIVTD